MALILPILSALSEKSSQEQDWRSMIVSAVLSLASFNAVSFKEVLRSMDGEDRVRLESVLRSALEEQEEVQVEYTKPSISLKSDFAWAE